MLRVSPHVSLGYQDIRKVSSTLDHHNPSVQNCKQLFMYMNNWDKGVAPAICPRILSTSAEMDNRLEFGAGSIWTLGALTAPIGS